MTEAVFGTRDDIEAAPAEPQEKYIPVSRETVQDNSASLLDELAEVASKDIAKTVIFEVDEAIRPGGWRLAFNAVITEKEIQKYTAAGGLGKDASKQSNVKATAYALVEKNTGIFKGNQQVMDEDGDPLKLTSREWLEKVGKQNARNYDALRVIIQFLGDAQVIKMGSALLKEAGFNDQMEAVDPTLG